MLGGNENKPVCVGQQGKQGGPVKADRSSNIEAARNRGISNLTAVKTLDDRITREISSKPT